MSPEIGSASEGRKRPPRTNPPDSSSADAHVLAKRPEDADAAVGIAYDSRAVDYVRLGGTIELMDPRDRELIGRWRDETAGLVLDAGCGPGHWTRFLHDAGRESVGVDISAEFLRFARRNHPDVRFEQASFRELPAADASVGGILAWYSLIHTDPSEVPVVLREFARVLAPGGSLLLGFFVGEPRQPFAHAVTTAHFWSADALGALLTDAGFEVTFTEQREREPGEMSVRPHGALIARRVPWAR
ncbi:class I SAM-dependent methyltransferase [Microbacterium sp. EST19A]|uniref:class I SAM-dependent methyltransferase n=1 Tax=Microbacterium sp. EST19A TaxID=2862681 RepID=UPI001CBC71BD|nr:class I SAM-dependent methyltransferase [Microbacterium sp. EST19A]